MDGHAENAPAMGDSPPIALEPRFDTTAILVRAQAGDPLALNALCERFLPRLTHWATGRLPGYCRELMQTDDLVQEAVVNTIGRLSSAPQRGSALYAYLRTAVLNRIRDEIRRVQRRAPVTPITGEERDPSPSAHEELLGREVQRQYDAALERLKPEEREAVIGRIELGLGFAELAEALGKSSADAARMAVNRAVVRLGQEMAAPAQGDRSP